MRTDTGWRSCLNDIDVRIVGRYTLQAWDSFNRTGSYWGIWDRRGVRRGGSDTGVPSRQQAKSAATRAARRLLEGKSDG